LFTLGAGAKRGGNQHLVRLAALDFLRSENKGGYPTYPYPFILCPQVIYSFLVSHIIRSQQRLFRVQSRGDGQLPEDGAVFDVLISCPVSIHSQGAELI